MNVDRCVCVCLSVCLCVCLCVCPCLCVCAHPCAHRSCVQPHHPLQRTFPYTWTYRHNCEPPPLPSPILYCTCIVVMHLNAPGLWWGLSVGGFIVYFCGFFLMVQGFIFAAGALRRLCCPLVFNCPPPPLPLPQVRVLCARRMDDGSMHRYETVLPRSMIRAPSSHDMHGHDNGDDHAAAAVDGDDDAAAAVHGDDDAAAAVDDHDPHRISLQFPSQLPPPPPPTQPNAPSSTRPPPPPPSNHTTCSTTTAPPSTLFQSSPFTLQRLTHTATATAAPLPHTKCTLCPCLQSQHRTRHRATSRRQQAMPPAVTRQGSRRTITRHAMVRQTV